MSNENMSDLDTFGSRLRKERVRLGLNQTDFAEIGGIQKDGQVKYEADKREPGAAYMTAIAAAGVDILYVLTGVITVSANDDEVALLSGYRELSERDKTSVLGMIDNLRPRRHALHLNLSDEDIAFFSKRAKEEGVHVDVIVKKMLVELAEKSLGLPSRSRGHAKSYITPHSDMGKSIHDKITAIIDENGGKKSVKKITVGDKKKTTISLKDELPDD